MCMCIGVYMNMHKCTYVSHDGLHVHFQTPAFTFACFWCMCDVNNILYLSALWGYVSAISFAPVRCYAAPLVLAAWRLIRAECRYAQCVTLTGMQDRPLPASKNSNILVILHYKMQKFACPGLRWYMYTYTRTLRTHTHTSTHTHTTTTKWRGLYE